MGTTKSETLHGNLGRAHLLCQLWRSLRVFLLLRFVGRTQTSKGSLLSLLSLLGLENQMFPRSSSEQGCLRLGPVASAVSPWCHIVKDGKASKHAAYQNVVFRCAVLQHSCNGCSGCQSIHVTYVCSHFRVPGGGHCKCACCLLLDFLRCLVVSL